jgi:hypothetical protein
MGILVDLAEWRHKKEEEALQKELDEIAQLREEVKEMLGDLDEYRTWPIYIPIYSTEGENEEWSSTLLDTWLNQYTWPIDSSDL